MYKKILASGITASMLIVGGTYSFAEAEQNDNPQTEQVQDNNIQQGNDQQDKQNKDNDKQGKADDNSKLKNKLFIRGGDLSENEQKDTEDKLDVKSSFKEYTVTTADVQKYTRGTYDYIHSSASIVPKKFKKGVDVEIKTPENITRITKEQYINAAISSGIKNADIEIASVDKVSGEGALTGIYKGLEKEGVELNDDDIHNANDEMDNLADISEENDDVKGYSDEAMNNAVADMKEQVADKKDKGDDVSDEDIQKIVDDTLKDKGLDDKINDNQKNKIVNIIINVSDSDAINKDPDAYKQQTSKYKDKLEKSAGKALDKAKDMNTKENKDKAKGFFSKIGDFFKNLF